MSEGKPVTNLRVDGQDFFTGNVREFIQKLPTRIFDKVQILNDFGQDASFSGIKTNSSIRTINLVTKPGMNKGIFGNIDALAGSNKLAGVAGSGNIWSGAKQISATADLKTAKDVIGSNIYNRAGVTYADRLSDHFKFGSSYSYNSSRAGATNQSYSETITSSGLIKNIMDNQSASRGDNHTFSFNSRYEPDKQTFIKIEGNIKTAKNTDSSGSFSQQSGLLHQDLRSNITGFRRNPSASAEFSIGKRLDKHGRVLTLNTHYFQENSTDEHQTNRLIGYYQSIGGIASDSIFNSVTQSHLKRTGVDADLSYLQPTGKKSFFSAVYEFSKTNQSSRLFTFQDIGPDKGGRLIDSLSGAVHNFNINHKIDLREQFESDKFTIAGGMSFQRNAISGIYQGRIGNIGRSVYNYAPILSFTYNPNKHDSFDLKYAGSSESPSIDQLQPVTDASNIQNIIIGNPDLKPSFNHQGELNFRHYGIRSKQMLTFTLVGSFTQNEIVSNTTIIRDTLNSYKQITSYVNANGGLNLRGNYNYSMQINLSTNFVLKMTFTGNANFSRQVVFVDNQRTFNHSTNFLQAWKTSFRRKKMETEAGINYAISGNQYIIGKGLKNTIEQWSFYFSERLYIFKNNTLAIDAKKSISSGYSNIGNTNPFVVNGSVSQTFFKNNLVVKFLASDIFDKSSRISQTISGNTIFNNRSMYVTRYFTLSAGFRMSRFPGK
ncbi:outer membrane beta-barrel protein [Mucilaginibacter sp. Mucisp86]|uniref:outer membrane beta-barrel protein n=1 Tax=Mucilaginibacter sp. Mucisp86 TaxID=3243060 RepID=UPI0039B5D828